MFRAMLSFLGWDRRLMAAAACLILLTLAGPSPARAQVFSNSDAILIPASGDVSPFPSEITVSGMGPELASVSVSLFGYNHAFSPDLQIAVQSPAGTSVMLMGAESGENDNSTPLDLTFDDAALQSLPSFSPLTSGLYRPTDQGFSSAFSSPGPGTWQTTLGSLTGENPNGVWRLFVEDFVENDGGAIAGGWSLVLTSVPEPRFHALTLGCGLLILAVYRSRRGRLRRE
jgi:subtilisin-like proprotein convertase family protein